MKRFLPLLLAASCSKPTHHDPVPAPAVSSVVASPEAPRPQPEKPEKIISKYSTKYDVKQTERAWNIEQVAKKLDGTVFEPGKSFSFNERVGPRDEASGFKRAPVIFLGEMTKDFGGGTCQTSSTLYAAAIYAGLDVVDHRGHSRPSTYIGKGLDATVAYPDVDLKLTNPYNEPITLRAKAENGELTEWFVGDVDIPEVKTRWLGGQLIDFERRYRKTNTYRNDHKRRKQSGQPGQNGVLVVEYKLGDKHWSKRFSANYKPVDEVWEVGLGWDMVQKPWEPSTPAPEISIAQ